MKFSKDFWRPVSILLAGWFGLVAPVAAQMTQAEAYAVCANDAQMIHDSAVASHGPQYVKPWYCALEQLTATGYAYSSVNEVDVYHNGNYTVIKRDFRFRRFPELRSAQGLRRR